MWDPGGLRDHGEPRYVGVKRWVVTICSVQIIILVGLEVIVHSGDVLQPEVLPDIEWSNRFPALSEGLEQDLRFDVCSEEKLMVNKKILR